MSEDSDFCQLLGRVRAGDASAAEELVRRYEPAIRRVVRLRLTDPRLRRVFDSLDICQSVLANFFVRVAGGQFELERSEDLLRLLATMARNKVLSHARQQQAQRRDRRRLGGAAALATLADRQPSPSQVLSLQELAEQMRRRLSVEERYLMEQRALGREWTAIAAELGQSAEALRKQLARALDRVTSEMGLAEESNG
jgi:RNA polymerase sigma-70 factor (ECF subfamily)